MKRMPVDLLRQLVLYNPETGAFTRAVDSGYRGCHKAGTPLGSNTGHGYLKFDAGGVRGIYAHRAAWAYVHGMWPSMNIDHINGNRSDNRIANLRDVPQRVNNENKAAASRRSSTGILGVSVDRKSGLYVAQIVADGRYFSRRFTEKEEAAEWYAGMKLGLHDCPRFNAERIVRVR